MTNITEFQKLIGKLIYLDYTRPDISYIVQVFSQFMHSLMKSHLKVALRLLRFLKNDPGKWVSVTKVDCLSLKGFMDVDWANALFREGM